MSDLQSTLDTIDQALVDCDASSLPALGYTCLRPECVNGVPTWLNPYYCSERCRGEANPTSPDHKATEWIAASNWGSVGYTRQEDLPDPDGPVVLGMDPAGGPVIAAQVVDGHVHIRQLVDTQSQLEQEFLQLGPEPRPQLSLNSLAATRAAWSHYQAAIDQTITDVETGRLRHTEPSTRSWLSRWFRRHR